MKNMTEWKQPNQNREIPPTLKNLVDGLTALKGVIESQIEKDVLEVNEMKKKLAKLQQKKG
jgi:flagellar hook-associated protein FlgK